jgi:hypothetical protein
MIDIHREHMLTITSAARELPGKPHVSTLWRWINRGVRGVRLSTIMVGGTRYTSREALQTFCEATTAAADGTATPSRTSKQRQRDIDRAERELSEAGI